MNAAHFHLMLNHFPIAGMIFATLILFVALVKKNETMARVGYGLIILTALLTIPTFLTGEPSEDVVEGLAGISKEVIHAHEEAAEVSAWLIWATSFFALASFVLPLKKINLPKWLLPVTLLLSVACVGFVGWSNFLGGKIIHQEIRGQ